LILTFGPVSGAHFNPAVTLADASQGGLPWNRAAAYVVVQFIGAILGVVVAHLMFDEPIVMASTHVRSGASQVFSEFVATFGLLAVIWGVSRRRAAVVPFAVAAYITAAYWFTASTSFANPAVTGRAGLDRHVRRHTCRRRSGLHRGADRWGCRGDALVSVACTVTASRGPDVVVPHQQTR
jgi:glycerol uptake facilitator-like aquaporin